MDSVYVNFRVVLVTLVGLFTIAINYSCEKADGMEPISEAKDQRIEDKLFSQYTLDSFPMKIFIPREYENDKNLPVVYLLDGLLPSPLDNVVFFDEVVGSMQKIGLKAILVAVGDKRGVAREEDFLGQGCRGTVIGFDNFFNFLTKELVPYIDSKYESDPTKRTLIGHSHGGNFAYNAFFNEDPNNIIFRGYLAVDPTECDNNVLIERIDNMDFPSDARMKIYLSEVDYDVEKVYNFLKDKDFPWLFMDFERYPDENHVSVTRPSIRKGLQFIYGI